MFDVIVGIRSNWVKRLWARCPLLSEGANSPIVSSIYYNQALPETFQGLVQPEESEQTLNGFRVKTKRPLDWEVQCRRAYSSFEKNGFLVLVDGNK